jgi:hypothetical protein
MAVGDPCAECPKRGRHGVKRGVRRWRTNSYCDQCRQEMRAEKKVKASMIKRNYPALRNLLRGALIALEREDYGSVAGLLRELEGELDLLGDIANQHLPKDPNAPDTLEGMLQHLDLLESSVGFEENGDLMEEAVRTRQAIRKWYPDYKWGIVEHYEPDAVQQKPFVPLSEEEFQKYVRGEK